MRDSGSVSVALHQLSELTQDSAQILVTPQQRTQVDAFDNIAANTRTGSVQRRGSRLQPGQFTHLVERLAALDRD